MSTVKTEKISLSVNQLKKIIFPAKGRDWEYIVDKGRSLSRPQTRYVFPEPGPKLNLVMDPSGSTFTIVDVEPVNLVLEYIGLPPVEEGAQELSTITGSTLDIYKYRWDDYPNGVLFIERGLCRNLDSLETYHCITNITIRPRG